MVSGQTTVLPDVFHWFFDVYRQQKDIWNRLQKARHYNFRYKQDQANWSGENKVIEDVHNHSGRFCDLVDTLLHNDDFIHFLESWKKCEFVYLIWLQREISINRLLLYYLCSFLKMTQFLQGTASFVLFYHLDTMWQPFSPLYFTYIPCSCSSAVFFLKFYLLSWY